MQSEGKKEEPEKVEGEAQPTELKEEPRKYEFENEDIQKDIEKLFEIFEEKQPPIVAKTDNPTEPPKEPPLNERFMKLDKLLTLLRALDQVPSDKDLELYKAEFDKYNKGLISLHDVLTIMTRRLKKTDTEEELIKALQLFATDDEKEKIPNEVFRNALASMGNKFTSDQIENIIKEADTDGDGSVEISDFAKILMSEGKATKRKGKKGKKKKKAK